MCTTRIQNIATGYILIIQLIAVKYSQKDIQFWNISLESLFSTVMAKHYSLD